MTAGPDELERLSALRERALAAVFRGRPRTAERLLKQALAASRRPATDDSARVAARCTISLAYVEFELRGFEAAWSRLDEAQQLVATHPEPALDVALANQRGVLLLRVGRMSEARAEFDQAVLADAEPSDDRCKALLNRAVASMELGQIRRARDDLNRCLADAERLHDDVIKLWALHDLGFVEFLAGDIPAALRLMDAARAMNANVNPGVALLGKAQVLVEAGLLRDADETLAAAADIFRRERLIRDLGEAELERARCALALGDVTMARRLAAAAGRHFDRRAGDWFRRSAELVRLQSALAGGARPRAVCAAASRLRQEFEKDGLRLQARIAALLEIEARLAIGETDAATALLAELGPPHPSDPITGRMHFHYVEARASAARGDYLRAGRRTRRALGELAGYQARFGSIDLRTASAVHGRHLAELDIGLARRSNRPAAVFAAAERARAVSSRLPSVRPPSDPTAADLLAELRQVIEALRAAGPDRAAAARLLGRRRALEREIVARTWSRSGAAGPSAPVTLATANEQLRQEHRTMVMYVQSGGSLVAVVTGRRTRLVELGPAPPQLERIRRARADLDVLASPRLPGGLRASVQASLGRSLKELDCSLLAPLGTDGDLVIVSTGLLGQLPWASLPSARGRPVVVAPSATKWVHSRGRGPSDRARVVAMSGPDLGRGTEEAAAAAAAWPGGTAMVGADATAEAFRQAMGTATVLHVAAHGVHQPENPLFSFVRMADGPVFAHELDQTHRAPEHVVLSACEVGLATIRPGDEALGLASVLLHLGTRSVIASVARVGDEVAERTMAAYHRRLAAGDDSSVALAEALVEVDADVTPPFVNFGAAWSVGASSDLEPARPVA